MHALLSIALSLLPLVDDWPCPQDATRFPAAAVCRQQLAVNQAFAEWLRWRMEYETDWATWQALQAAQHETSHAKLAWEWALTAQGEWPGYTALQGLRGLRSWIGPEAYYRGSLPPAVPAERFAWR